jgi:hypothetical protein
MFSYKPAYSWLCLLIALMGVAAFPTAAGAQVRLTSASNVRLRSSPATDATIIAGLPLGTELRETAQSPDGAWIQVQTKNGPEGWVLESLTREVPEAQSLRVAEEIIAERLARQGDGFQALAELVAFIERSMSPDGPPDARARLALFRLRALDATLETIPADRGAWSQSMQSWVAAHSAEIAFSEPAGEWMVGNAFILDLHSKHRGSVAADEIAWFAVLANLPGECEGFLACEVEATDRLTGEYLRREPRGAYVSEAVRQITESAENFWTDPISFEPGRDCPELVASLGSLRAAVAGSNAPTRAHLIDLLDGIRRRCPA